MSYSKRSNSIREPREREKTIDIIPDCSLALILKPLLNNRHSSVDTHTDGRTIFRDWQQQNATCFWNPSLLMSIKCVRYIGYLEKYTLLISGAIYEIETIRTAWARRVLVAPSGFKIRYVGDIDRVGLTVIPRVQFVPLEEAICLLTSTLNSAHQLASLQDIQAGISNFFPRMNVPNATIITDCISALISAGKLQRTTEGMLITTPEVFHLLTSNKPSDAVRPMLLSNEEALEVLYQRTVSSSGGRRPPATSSRPRDLANSVTSAPWRGQPSESRGRITANHVQSNETNQNLTESVGVTSQFSDQKRKIDGTWSKFVSKIFGFNNSKKTRSSVAVNGDAIVECDNPLCLEALQNSFQHSKICDHQDSCFTKEKRRPKSSKNRRIFSAQFPPPEWLEGTAKERLDAATAQVSRCDFTKYRSQSMPRYVARMLNARGGCDPWLASEQKSDGVVNHTLEAPPWKLSDSRPSADGTAVETGSGSSSERPKSVSPKHKYTVENRIGYQYGFDDAKRNGSQPGRIVIGQEQSQAPQCEKNNNKKCMTYMSSDSGIHYHSDTHINYGNDGTGQDQRRMCEPCSKNHQPTCSYIDSGCNSPNPLCSAALHKEPEKYSAVDSMRNELFMYMLHKQ